MGFYFAQRSDITPTATGSWETFDLSGAPWNIPASAVVEVVCSSFDQAGSQTVGARSIGSAIERKLELRLTEAVGGADGGEQFTLHVRTDPNSRIQTFSSAPAVTFFSVVGYWLDGEYVDDFQSFKISQNSTWLNHDLTSFGLPASGVAEIICTNSGVATELLMGVRERGSDKNRTFNIHEAEGGGHAAVGLMVNSDTDSQIQAFTASSGDTDFYFAGYWSVPPGRFIEAADDIGVPSTPSTFEDKDLSSFGVNNFSVPHIVFSNNEVGVANLVGHRPDGDSSTRRFRYQEAEDGGEVFGSFHSQTSGNATVELFTDDISNSIFILAGYWVKGPVAELSFFIGGQPSGAMDLFTIAADTQSGIIDLFISGVGVVSSGLDLFLQVPELASSGLDLLLFNSFTSNDVDLFLAQKTSSGVLSLFEQAALPFSLFARGPDQTVVDALDFIIYGGSGLEFTNDSVILFLSGALDTSPIISGELFARVVTSFPLSSGIISWPLFANVDGQQRDAEVSLFINAGANFSGDMSLFIQQDDEDLTRIGFTPNSGIFNWFARVPSGSIDSIPLFIEGFIFPSGDINLTISGSVNTINSSVNLFLNGFFPSSSGNVTFFMSDPIGTIDKSKTLFIRGDGC